MWPSGWSSHTLITLGILASLLTETYSCLCHASHAWRVASSQISPEFMNHSLFKVLFHFSIYPCNTYSSSYWKMECNCQKGDGLHMCTGTRTCVHPWRRMWRSEVDVRTSSLITFSAYLSRQSFSLNLELDIVTTTETDLGNDRSLTLTNPTNTDSQLITEMLETTGSAPHTHKENTIVRRRLNMRPLPDVHRKQVMRRDQRGLRHWVSRRNGTAKCVVV